MPSLQELQAEEAWRNERVPTSLSGLRRKLLDRYGWDDNAIGIIGDQHHLAGYHRSREWIRTSAFCADHDYSVTETPGNRSGGNGDNVAGVDIETGEASTKAIYARLRTAKAAGRLPMIRQIILENSPWHVHLSFDRGMLDMDMQPVYDAITHDDNGGIKMVQVHVILPELRQGAEGKDVVTLQALLTARGIPTKLDGVFGPITDANTRQMQTNFGAEDVDGVWGPETWTIGFAGADLV